MPVSLAQLGAFALAGPLGAPLAVAAALTRTAWLSGLFAVPIEAEPASAGGWLRALATR